MRDADDLWNRPIGRRTFGLGALGLAALAACGGETGTPVTAPSSAGWQPVSVKHAFGTAEIAKRPARVVSAGYTEQDFLLALGVTPVAVTDWYGDQPNAVWPWARAAPANR